MHLVLLGAPGSGKGSYAVELKKRYGIPHISTGEIFREAIDKQTPTGVVAKFHIDQGKLVPDDVTIQIVKERLALRDCQKGFLLDGFPRTIEQAEALTKILQELGIKLDAVIDLEVDNQLVITRIINRRMCSNCGKGYNLLNYPPKKPGICDDCGADLYIRKDDTKETITNRLQVYTVQTEPLVEYYRERGLLMSVDSNGTIEGVTADIVDKLESR